MSFTIRTAPEPETDVPEFICVAPLSREYASTCIFVCCAVSSRCEVPKVHSDFWWGYRDEGCDFDEGGVTVKTGKRCFLMSAFLVIVEGRGKSRSARHGVVVDQN